MSLLKPLVVKIGPTKKAKILPDKVLFISVSVEEIVIKTKHKTYNILREYYELFYHWTDLQNRINSMFIENGEIDG